MTRISNISVIVLTKNEEAGLGNTLEKLADFDDVIVVDSLSEDRTVAIANECGARVVNFTWNGTYPKKKQWALENAGPKNKWVLLLDADEYPSSPLVRELSELAPALESTPDGAYDINLLYRFGGRYLRHGHVVTKRSLLHVDRTSFPIIDDLDVPGIREVEGHYQPVSRAAIGKLKSRIVHDDRDPVASWFARHNRYSDWEAHLRLNDGLRRDIASKRTAKGQIFDAVPFKPLLFFVYAYVARAGFLDGRAGFDYAAALSMYYWQIGVKTRELQAETVSYRDRAQESAGLYLAVLPRYRTVCMTLVREQIGPELSAWVSPAHLDESVRSDSSVGWYTNVRMVRLWGRAFLQTGGWREALRRGVLVVDLNPRSLTAWLFLVLRRATRRRTLVWGHLYPQAGAHSATGGIRRIMRRIADGMITYTYSDMARAKADAPGQPVWVAPNALYLQRDIVPAPITGVRGDVIYVGRFEPAKKVALLVESFALLARSNPSARLMLVGGGSEEDHLRRLCEELGVSGRTVFAGWVSDNDKLAGLYASAFIAVSPGFAGLGLTQSLGFGLPIVVSRDEPHSPEIELAEFGGVRWFDTDSPSSLASQLELAFAQRGALPDADLSSRVADTYSAEAMADGLVSAIKGEGGEG